MEKGRFLSVLEELCEIFCSLGDYEWDTDYDTKRKRLMVIEQPTVKKSS